MLQVSWKIVFSSFFQLFQKSYSTEEQQLEDEQDLMGLYESELNKQIHLRNKQRKEWDVMNKKMEADMEKKKTEISQQQRLLEQDKRDEDRVEIRETNKSKNLVATMVQSAHDEEEDDDDTLLKAVEVLQDQNGTFKAMQC